MSEDLTAHDGRRRRCPMLGHDLTFAYCRAPGRDLPCGRIADCWWEAFDVAAWLRRHFTAEQRDRFLVQPRPKMLSIVELIERARRTAAEQGGGPDGPDADS